MNFKYLLKGSINNGSVVGEGSGNVVPKDGISEMEVFFDSLASGWDPRTIVLMCCSRAFAMGAYEHGSSTNLLSAANGYVTIGRHLEKVYRRAILRDSDGKIYADIEASSETDLRGNQGFDESRIENGYSLLHPGVSGIAEILPFSGVMMQAGPSVVNIMVNYQVLTEDNKTLYGFTFYPHYLPEQVRNISKPQFFEVEIVDQQFENNRLYVKTYASVSELESRISVPIDLLSLA
jgi:hypothetical protein